MLATFSALLWVLLEDACPLYDKIYKLWRALNQTFIKSVKSKFTRIWCAHITWQVLGETRLFFDQRLGPNDFTNRGPRRSPTADLGGLIEDVRRNKFFDSVTIPRQWNHQENINTWGTHQGKIQGGGMQANGVYSGNVQRPTSLEPYATQEIKGIQNLQGKGWQTQNCEHHHPVLVKFMAKFLKNIQHLIYQKYWSQETKQRNICQNVG